MVRFIQLGVYVLLYWMLKRGVDMDHDIYICVLNSAGVLISVTIIDPQYSSETVKQLRANNRRIKTFKTYSEYCEFIDEYSIQLRGC